MIALAGRAGFYGAPVSKLLLCHAFVTYFLFTFPLQHFRHLFHYNQDVFVKRQFKKMFFSKIVFLDLPDLIFSSLLIYNFRIFERRFGSRKFISHLLSTTFLASVLELLVFATLNRFDIRLGDMPSGLFSMVFPLYVPFYSTIPRVALMKIMGVPVTGKTINYILGLQMASSEVENMLVVGCAVFAGILWRINFFMVQTFVQVPRTVGNMFNQWLGRFLESADSQTSTLPMGATLELQQRERWDRLEQQMMANAIQASRRMEISRPQPMTSQNLDSSLLGNMNMNRQLEHHQQQEDVPVTRESTETSISEEQVQQFVAMGFSDARVRQALRSANNNPQVATNFLLQDV